MHNITLELPESVQQQLWKHLLPTRMLAEEAAFVFATTTQVGNDVAFQFVNWIPIPPEGFLHRSKYALELTDGTRADVIKKAHDLNASIVEFHSHCGRASASFSGSDVAGFEEFVPHVWWRLKGKPYLAVVVARTGLDALAWIQDPKVPETINEIRLGPRSLRPTNLTFKNENDRCE